jgi:hypothetical protein
MRFCFVKEVSLTRHTFVLFKSEFLNVSISLITKKGQFSFILHSRLLTNKLSQLICDPVWVSNYFHPIHLNNKKVAILRKCNNRAHTKFACVSNGVKVMSLLRETMEFSSIRRWLMLYFILQSPIESFYM